MEVKELVGLGLAVLTGLGITKIWPIISNWVTHKSEERKLKMELQSNGSSEIANIWKQQYEESKEELKVVNEQKIHLEVKVATLKERLNRYAKEHGVVLSVKPKD
jgi:hypothetical protein